MTKSFEGQPSGASLSQYLVGMDVPIDGAQFAFKSFLAAFADVSSQRPDLHLALAGRRSSANAFSVANCLQDMGIEDRVTFLPYHFVCHRFPCFKMDCDAWIDRNVLRADTTTSSLIRQIETAPRQKSALFFTSFHPGKYEGNSRLMRLWLRRLRSAGYVIHLVHYNIERRRPDLETTSLTDFDFYHEVECTTGLVGYNQNGQNVHVDDWCGIEALEAVKALVADHAFDLAIVNYTFMSAIFDVLPCYTKKILLSHDAFRDRNKRMLAQGYAEAGWISIDAEGEALACRRADVVVALQEEESAYFKTLDRDPAKVWTIPPVFDKRYATSDQRSGGGPSAGKLRVGYVASSNWVNETNMGAFLRTWATLPDATSLAEIIIAGSFSTDIFCRLNQDGPQLLSACQPVLIGKQNDLAPFYAGCDLIINPERGGTGIKIKTLEALAHGKAVLSTSAGSVGLESNSPYHHAADATALARLVFCVARDRSHLPVATADSVALYERYVERFSHAMDDLIGPPRLQGSWNPKVSIIIPFYNVEPFLAECLESVLAQSYANMEIILVDDGSTDGSRGLAETYLRRDCQIRLISHEHNAGLGPARNSGVKEAQGDFLFFLDSDDLLSSPASIEILVSLAEGSDASAIIGASQRLATDGAISDYDLSLSQTALCQSGTPLFGRDAFAAVMGFSDQRYVPMRAWGVMIARDYYCQIDVPFPAVEHEDMATMPFVYLLAPKGIVYTHRPVVRYRERPGSLSASPWSIDKIERHKQLWTVFKQRIGEHCVGDHLSDVGLWLIVHMLWRLNSGPTTPAARRAALRLALYISDDITGTRFPSYFSRNLRYIRSLHHDASRATKFPVRFFGVVPAFAQLVRRLVPHEQPA